MALLTNTTKKTINVLIVDDSAIVRKVIKAELEKHNDINVVGVAPDPYIARDKILKLKPDVITLDVEMPRMDGITFLKKLMASHPIPTIVISSVTPAGGEMALEALDAGAVDVLCKPSDAYSVGQLGKDIIQKVRAASLARLQPIKSYKKVSTKQTSLKQTTNKIIAIGASTGGVDALCRVITKMPALSPGILIVQHMPAQFTSSFAQRLNGISQMDVKEAVNGDSVLNGQVLLAPGGYHMVLKRSGAKYYVEVKRGPQVCHQCPSVEVLFHSVSQIAGANSIGVMLTGMGDDGAKAMVELHNNGAKTIAQDEKSCVVFGMPKRAIELGAADHICSLDDIAQKITLIAKRMG